MSSGKPKKIVKGKNKVEAWEASRVQKVLWTSLKFQFSRNYKKKAIIEEIKLFVAQKKNMNLNNTKNI